MHRREGFQVAPGTGAGQLISIAGRIADTNSLAEQPLPDQIAGNLHSIKRRGESDKTPARRMRANSPFASLTTAQ